MDYTIFADYIERYNKGEISVLAQLYEKTYQRVYFLAYNIAKNHEDAQDITQEVYIKAFSKLDTLENPVAFIAWLSKITLNTSLNYIKRSHDDIIDSESNRLAEIFLENENIPHELAENAERRDIILKMIDQLPPSQRRAVLLFYYEHMSTSEIADAENVTVSTVTSRLAYARTALRRAVMDYEHKTGVSYLAGSFASAMTVLSAGVSSALLAPETAGAIFAAVMNALGIRYVAGASFKVISETADIDFTTGEGSHKNTAKRLTDNIRIFFKSSLILKVYKPAAVLILCMAAVLAAGGGIIIGSKLVRADVKISERPSAAESITEQTAAQTDISAAKIVSVSSYSEFADALARGETEIEISGNLYADRTVHITSAVSISGGGTISRLNPQNGEFFSGHILKIENGCSAVLGDITLDGACSDERGNFIRSANPMIAVMQSSSLTLNGTYLHSNNTLYDSTLTGYGGAVMGYSPKSIRITGDTLIEHNLSADCGGGVCALGGEIIMDSGTIRENSTSMFGGAIAIGERGKITVTGGTIESNSSDYSREPFGEKTPYEDGRGGAIYTAYGCTLEISGGTFRSNTSSGIGGVIAVDQDSKINISGGTFEKNRTSAGFGGVVHAQIRTTINITGGSFVSNTSASLGGAIFTSDNCKLIIAGGSFENNISERDGGAVYTRYSDVRISDGAKFILNSGTYGGALSLYYGTAVISDSVFRSNNAFNLGGAIFIDNCESLLIDGAVFESNSAYAGGAGFIKETPTSMVGGAIRDNTAYHDGGALICEAADITLNRGEISNNYAATKCGGILICKGSSLSLSKESEFVFSNNTAPKYSKNILIQEMDKENCDIDEKYLNLIEYVP